MHVLWLLWLQGNLWELFLMYNINMIKWNTFRWSCYQHYDFCVNTKPESVAIQEITTSAKCSINLCKNLQPDYFISVGKQPTILFQHYCDFTCTSAFLSSASVIISDWTWLTSFTCVFKSLITSNQTANKKIVNEVFLIHTFSS